MKKCRAASLPAPCSATSRRQGRGQQRKVRLRAREKSFFSLRPAMTTAEIDRFPSSASSSISFLVFLSPFSSRFRVKALLQSSTQPLLWCRTLFTSAQREKQAQANACSCLNSRPFFVRFRSHTTFFFFSTPFKNNKTQPPPPPLLPRAPSSTSGRPPRS